MKLAKNIFTKLFLAIYTTVCILCTVYYLKFNHLPLYMNIDMGHQTNQKPMTTLNRNVGHTQPLKPEIHPSKFLLKPELQGATVLKRSKTNWSRDDVSCEGDKSFVKVDFHSPAGITPMYVHPIEVDKWVSGAVIRGGVWESNYVNKMYNLLQNQSDLDFVDIGANIGVYGITMAQLRRKVILVDPLLKNVQKLCHTVRDGRFKNVYVIHNAMSSERFSVGFTSYIGNVGGTKVRIAEKQDNETAVAVLLDDLLEVFNLTKVALKMDVESHEHRVLEGAEKFFSKVDVRYILMEWYRNKLLTGNIIVDFLSRHKMAPYNPKSDAALDPKDYKKWAGMADIFWKKIA